MHVERLTKIAEWLEAGGDNGKYKFDMEVGVQFNIESFDRDEVSNFQPKDYVSCDTACCIAGAAVTFFNAPLEKVETLLETGDDLDKGYLETDGTLPWRTIREAAIKLLNISPWDALSLFTPDTEHPERFLEEFSDPAWAARVIRGFIATGEVDWLRYE